MGCDERIERRGGEIPKLPRLRGLLVTLRIIPARAGQTREWSRSAARAADHPRACGANLLSWITVSASAGSSPRVRGKRKTYQYLCGVPRIIPARAGQTPPIIAYGFFVADHPRACGANVPHGYHTSSAIGSSPRVRGKLDIGQNRPFCLRIIPARAGQTKPSELS